MNSEIVIPAVLFMGGLGAFLAGVIAFANRKLAVVEDPRIDQVEQMLPGSNCGACGNPGCRAFAEALVGGTENPAKCTISSAGVKLQIASHLGVELGDTEKRVARLACAGGAHVARQRTRYTGMESCRAAALVAGGGKGCYWGCLGLKDCGVVCNFGAISFSENGLPSVDLDKCTAFVSEDKISLQMMDVHAIDQHGDDFFTNTGSPHFVRFVKQVQSQL